MLSQSQGTAFQHLGVGQPQEQNHTTRRESRRLFAKWDGQNKWVMAFVLIPLHSLCRHTCISHIPCPTARSRPHQRRTTRDRHPQETLYTSRLADGLHAPPSPWALPPMRCLTSLDTFPLGGPCCQYFHCFLLSNEEGPHKPPIIT